MSTRLAFYVVLAWLVSFVFISDAKAKSPLDCAELGCAAVLPGAERFEVEKDNAFVTGFNASGEVVGWVGRSTDIVDIKAYSGKPLITLIALGEDGNIKGARLIKHSEPILLVGIPVKLLHDFIAKYVDLPAISKVVVGKTTDPDVIEMDMISGATVTALAQNQTILKTARVMGLSTGAVSVADTNPGHFVKSDTLLSWSEMEQMGVFGRLTVTEAQVGIKDPQGVMVDLYYAMIDAPQVGRSLLGDLVYNRSMKELEKGQHLFLVLGNGTGSFKGSAFVRGGIFDRVRITQGLSELTWRDTDYKNFPKPHAIGSPLFKEGALFTARDTAIDPGQSFDFHFLGSRYTGALKREFHEFKSSYRLPSSIYKVDKALDEEPMYVQQWRNRKMDVGFLLLYLFAVILIFVLRSYSTRSIKLLLRLHIVLMAVGFVLIGLKMHAQPSVTQVLTLIPTVLGKGSWELFLMAPLIFILWIFIALVSIIWGRGVFCGWVCPYGSMSELVYKLGMFLGIKEVEIPRKYTFIRYAILLFLIVVYLYNSVQGELMAEVEPFKSTFLVRPWDRGLGYFGYWILLFMAAGVMFRPFCRILCPLGAALAILGSFRFSGPKRRKFCGSCTICAKLCEPKAIRPDGTIDPRECLSCMECEATYRSDEKCPPLITLKKLSKKEELSKRELKQMVKMKEARKDV